MCMVDNVQEVAVFLGSELLPVAGDNEPELAHRGD